jgi:type I restriction enzyme S subunit
MSTILKIDEVGTVLTGKTPKTSASEFWDGNLPFYTPSDMDGRRRLDGVKRYITEEGLKSVKNSAIPPNSVMVSCIGSDMGKVSLSVQHGVTNQQINTIIPNEEMVDFLYLYYSLLPRKSELQMLASGGSAQPILNKGQFSQLEVVIPSLQDQKAIAHILGTLDDKIELNQKMNQTLEDIAKAIFKSWFVDFDPVRAKAEGRPTGLPPEISDLFPDELVDSEIGEIPKGWVVTPLSECAIEIESGRRPKGGIDKSLRQGIPSVGAESITPAGKFDYSKVKYVTADFTEKMKKGRVQNFDVALYKDGGKPGQFIPRVGIYGDGFPFEHFYVNEHVFLLRSEQLGQPFLYRLISSRAFLDQLIAKGSAKAAQPGLNQTEVVESTFVRPSRDALVAFNDKTRPLLKRQFLLGKENEVLSDLRDTLLPKLISGELRIPDAEKFLEEAGI